MVLIYEDLESLTGKEGTISFPVGTHLWGTENNELVIDHLDGKLHNQLSGICILSRVKKVLATKGENSWFDFQKFKHVFKYDVSLWTASNGKFILVGVKRLWKIFDYGKVPKDYEGELL